jgi:ubiquinone/menaquinone biosynthesis C-methylase UbiE
MPFDADAVRTAWDYAADAYAHGQANGRDFYRLEFFGPAQIAMCGNVTGKKLLDVGCGSGYFARAMAERGAQVTGIDLSSKMIDHAIATGGADDYHVLDATQIADRFAADTFDMATSCMALQDMPEPVRALRAVHRVLKPGARFVISIEHPCTATPFRQWQRDEHKKKQWLCIDRYFERGPVETTWQRWEYAFTTAALHVPLEDWFAWIRDAGFTVRDLREPRASKEAVKSQPELADARRVPYFLMLELVR